MARIRPEPASRGTDWRARVANAVSRGGHVVYESDTEVHVVEGRSVNHILHLLLTVFTLGLWIIPWIIVVATGGEKRYTIQKSGSAGADRSTTRSATPSGVRGNRRPLPTNSPRAVAAARRSHEKGLHERRPDRICPLCLGTEDLPATAPRGVQGEGDTERRLREIDRLRETGLISEDEHQTHRSRVLDDLLGLSAREGHAESAPHLRDATTRGLSLAEAAESWQVHRADCGACNAAAPACDIGHGLYSVWTQLRDADTRP